MIEQLLFSLYWGSGFITIYSLSINIAANIGKHIAIVTATSAIQIAF